MPMPLTVSCFSKIQIGFTFLVPAHLGSPGQRAIKRVCVCVCQSEKSEVRRVQVRLSAVTLTTARHPGQSPGVAGGARWLRRLACDNGGVVVRWPGDRRLRVMLDHGRKAARSRPGVGRRVRWTLPYVTAASTSSAAAVTRTQPVISASLPVYSPRSHR